VAKVVEHLYKDLSLIPIIAKKKTIDGQYFFEILQGTSGTWC
jgi:hypothetical protein